MPENSQKIREMLKGSYSNRGERMKQLKERIVEIARKRGILSSVPGGSLIPLPGINDIEWYLTYHCNDKCAHCITRSGPEREETLSPSDAFTVVGHIADNSILKHLRTAFGDVEFRFELLPVCRELEKMEERPEKLTDSLAQAYADCLKGKRYISKMVGGSFSLDLPFGRPSIRLSGGEFFTWPFKLNGKHLPQEHRLCLQGKLLGEIRRTLPDYDVWILTNGRFATTQERTNGVIEQWTRYSNLPQAQGRTRICVSVDVFHRPPPKSSVEKMLDRIWEAARKYGLAAPFLYGIPNRTIAYMGRVFGTFRVGKLKKDEISNVSQSSFNPVTDMIVDPIDLVSSDGCRETTGFYFQHGPRTFLGSNINLDPCGHLVYCCACLGDYGDFVDDPQQSLQKVVTDPISLMLRRAETTIPLLNLAVELDPSIRVFGSGENAAVTGSTCYQMMTGERIESVGPGYHQRMFEIWTKFLRELTPVKAI